MRNDEALLRRTKEGYDLISDRFDAHRRIPWPEFRFFSETTPYKAKILDLGCGNGRLFWFLKEKWVEYIGIDLSEGQIAAAKRHFPNQKLLVADIRKLPFEDALFDEAWSIATFHHLPSRNTRKEAISEMYRVLVPNGKVKMTVWNLWQPRFFWQRIAARLSGRGRGVMIPWKDEQGNVMAQRFYYAFYPNELRDLFEANGFLVEEIFGVEDSEKVDFSQGKNICFIASKSDRIFVRGVPFDRITMRQAVDRAAELLDDGKQHLIVTPNPEMVLEAQENELFQKILQSSSLSLPDGIGILWAAATAGMTRWRRFFSLFELLLKKKKFTDPLPERVAGVEFFDHLMELCAKRGEKVFLLGAQEGVAQRCGLAMMKRYPNLQVAGTFAGSPNRPEEIISQVNASGTTVLAVAYGAPKQELFLGEHLSKMPTVRLGIGLGGTFDFYAGKQKRAPQLFRSLGIEWLWRLFLEPKRFFRIWNATGGFVGEMLKRG